MADLGDKFLKLVFEGGRFAGGSVPVEVLPELASVQQAIEKLARHIFLTEHEGRQRVPPGFFQAAQLFLVASEPNCYAAHLRLPGGAEHEPLFRDARKLFITSLLAMYLGTPLPNLPADCVAKIFAVGQRLGATEALVVHAKDAPIARIDQEGRARFAESVRRPLQRIETIEGEVVSVDDHTGKFSIRTADDVRVQLELIPADRLRLIDALQRRPIVRVSVRGLLMYRQPERRMTDIEDLEFSTDVRGPEVEKMWARIESFRDIEAGWLDGEGLEPSPTALAYARVVLARLLVEYPTLPRPSVYPTPEGSVQAEWVFGDWSADLEFGDDRSIRAGATHIETCESRSATFLPEDVSSDTVAPLKDWLTTLG